MKKMKIIRKMLLIIGVTALFTSCSNEDHQETSDLLSELQLTNKEQMEDRE